MSAVSSAVLSTDVRDIILASVIGLVTGAVLSVAYPTDAVDYFPDAGFTTGVILLMTAMLFFASGYKQVSLLPLLIPVSVIQMTVLASEYSTATFIATSPLVTSAQLTAIICAAICAPCFFLGRKVSYILD